jgi:hypothetical protein
MEITFENTNEKTFKEIREGDTFLIPEIDDSSVFMKVFANMDVELRTGMDVREIFDGYAVDLTTGEVFGCYDSEVVIPVKLEAKAIR